MAEIRRIIGVNSEGVRGWDPQILRWGIVGVVGSPWNIIIQQYTEIGDEKTFQSGDFSQIDRFECVK